MDFITLDQALSGIGSRIEFPEVFAKMYADLAHIYRTSEAAAILHQQLYNLPQLRPKWVALHSVTELPVYDETAADVGMELLLARAVEFRGRVGLDSSLPSLALTNARFAGPPPEKMVAGKNYRNPFKSPGSEIGFDRFELVRFLNDPRVAVDHVIRGGVMDQMNERHVPEMQQARYEMGVADGPVDRPANRVSQAVRRAVASLSLPEKADTWAKAIEATYELMGEDLGRTPSGAEVWLRMNDRPPLPDRRFPFQP